MPHSATWWGELVPREGPYLTLLRPAHSLIQMHAHRHSRYVACMHRHLTHACTHQCSIHMHALTSAQYICMHTPIFNIHMHAHTNAQYICMQTPILKTYACSHRCSIHMHAHINTQDTCMQTRALTRTHMITHV